MILTRIKRGAARTSILAKYRISQLRASQPKINWRSSQRLALGLVAARIALGPIPLATLVSPVQAASDDSGPIPRQVRISTSVVGALTFSKDDEKSILISSPALQPVAIGKSLATEQADAVIAQQNADAAAAEAARVQAEKDAAAAQIEQDRQAQLAAVAAQSAQNTQSSIPGEEDIKNIIRNAAAEYGVDADLLIHIAYCESGYDPSDRNKSGSSASGLFQFMPSTFRATPAGQAGRSIWDATANAEAAAWKISQGGIDAWNASRHCWSKF